MIYINSTIKESVMRKIFTFIGTFVIAGATFAQNIPSLNAAGYIKQTLNRGELSLLASPFEKFDGSTPTIAEILGTDVLPPSTTIFFWDVPGQTYESITYVDNAFNQGWKPDLVAATPFPRGRGFFIQIPSTALEASYDLFFHGEVPDARSAAAGTDVSLVTGLQMVSLAYPVSQSIDNTALAIVPSVDSTNAVAAPGDTIYSWDPASGYGAINFVDNFFNKGWRPVGFVFEPGKGYFYQSTGDKVWNELKPYSYP
ncbi:MAG: hypothetical protein ACI9TH_003062 [Kiritimatiellia bacterium]|jgi:hypothetical protein